MSGGYVDGWRVKGAMAALAMALLLAACGGGGSGSSSPPPKPQAGYGPASEYLDVSPEVAADQSHPYVKGKLVVVWAKQNKVGDDPAKGELPGIGIPHSIDYGWDNLGPKAPTLHPTNPAQVGTIATIYCRPVAAGHTYTNGFAAYDAECSVTVLDKDANRIVGHRVFSFPPPRSIGCPAGRCSRADTVGSYEPERIASYLEGLPRRP